MVRVKLNGKGPFNFLLDTGAPAMIMTEALAKKTGVKLKDGTGEFDLQIEGGIHLPKAEGIAIDMFQLKGMNAMGMAGVELHGVLGYNILAQFRIQYDFTDDRLLWTKLKYDPPKMERIGGGKGGQGGLEFMGNMMEVLGPLFFGKVTFDVRPRGFVGLMLTEDTDGVEVGKVVGDTPADKAGLKEKDRIIEAGGKKVAKAADLFRALDKLGEGDTLKIKISRDGEEKAITIKLGRGL